MIKKELSWTHFIIVHFLFLTSIFSYSHLNWREDLLLFTLMCLYAIGLAFGRITQDIRNSFLIFLLIFLLSQFFINNFHPGNVGWWFGSIPGRLSLFIAFLGSISLLLYVKTKPGHLPTQNSNKTLSDLVNKAATGFIWVGVVMFFLFVLNFEEFSPQTKLALDYSIYILIAVGFVLFHSLNFSFRYLSLTKMRVFFYPVAIGVLIFLVGIGAIKFYRVYVAYCNALPSKKALLERHSGAEDKLWQDVLELNKTLKINFINIDAMTELGKINMEKGNFRQASDYFEKILADQAFNFEANLGLAETAYRQQDWKKAQFVYRRTIYLKPNESSLYLPYIHSCIKNEEIRKALEFIQSLKQPDPLFLEPEDYLTIGYSFLKERKLEKAIAYLQKARESIPDSYEANFFMGRAYLESGHYTNGCEALERAVQLNPKSAGAYNYLGIGYENIHQDHKAIDAFERAVLIDNKNIGGFYHLKRLYAKVGLENKAIKTGNLIENIATKVIEAGDWKGTSGENVYQNGEMYWAGTMSADVLLKGGNVKFVMQAMGISARGVWPHMVVKLDNEIVGEVDVTSGKLKDYEFKKTAKAGKYNLNVSFINDEVALDKNRKIAEDRNLFVRKCWIVYE